eukprot:1193894-Prorocentrum_minimum.AAC.1
MNERARILVGRSDKRRITVGGTNEAAASKEDQSDAGSMGIFSRRTNQTQEAWVYSHDRPIRVPTSSSRRLRVADSSVMPKLVSTYPYLTCMVVGHKAAHLLLSDQ